MTRVEKQSSNGRLWKQVHYTGTIPSGRIGHTMCTSGDGMLYVWGGVNEGTEDSGRSTKYLGDFFRFDYYKKEWTEIRLHGDKPDARAFHTAVIHKGAVVIFGGCNGGGRFNKITKIFIDDKNLGLCKEVQASGTEPLTRYCHSAIEYKGCMYVFGGKCGGRNSNRRLDDMYKFDFETETWSVVAAKGTIPPPRSAHTAVVYGKKMLMFGGRDKEGSCCDDFYEFHLETQMWRKLECHNLLVRARHTAVVHNDTMIVFGGWNGRKKLNDLCLFNLDSNQIKFIHDADEANSKLPCRRECHTALTVGNSLLLFAGRFRGVFMNDSYEFPLQAPSLKYLIRSRLLSDEWERFNYSDPRHGLPESVTDYLNSYKYRFLKGGPPPTRSQHGTSSSSSSSSATTANSSGKQSIAVLGFKLVKSKKK